MYLLLLRVYVVSGLNVFHFNIGGKQGRKCDMGAYYSYIRSTLKVKSILVQIFVPN